MKKPALPGVLQEQCCLPFLLGCLFLHSWIHTTVTAPVFQIPVSAFFAFSVSTTTLLATLLLIALGNRLLRPLVVSRAWLIASATVSSLGTVMMSETYALIPNSPALSIIGTVLTAIGTGGLLAAWGEGYARFATGRTVAIATFAALAGSFFVFLAVNSFPETVALLIAALLPLASAFCAASVLRAPPQPPQALPSSSPSHPPSRAPVQAAPRPPSQAVSQALPSPLRATPPSSRTTPLSWLRLSPLPARIMVFIFAFSLPLNLLTSQISAASGDLVQSSWSLVFSCALVVLLLVAGIEAFLLRRGLSILSLAIVLLATGSLLLHLFSPQSGSVMIYVLIYGGYYLFVATFYTLLGQVIIHARQQAFVVFAVGNSLNVLGLLAGSLMGSLVALLSQPWANLISLLVMYVLFIIGYVLMAAGRNNPFREEASADLKQATQGLALKTCVAQYCSTVARLHKLSAREEEILNYLVRGRSIARIATETVLSQNTIKTHVNHIYEKLSVHSREELALFVEEAGAQKES
jgi:DNA-binding CsgD family transcriptional regulator